MATGRVATADPSVGAVAWLSVPSSQGVSTGATSTVPDVVTALTHTRKVALLMVAPVGRAARLNLTKVRTLRPRVVARTGSPTTAPPLKLGDEEVVYASAATTRVSAFAGTPANTTTPNTAARTPRVNSLGIRLSLRGAGLRPTDTWMAIVSQ